MFEILFIFGAVGWLMGVTWEYFCSLAAFPTLLVGAVSLPLLCWADYLATLERFQLEGLDKERPPVPPERFYWNLRKRRMRRTIRRMACMSVVGWTLALEFPADLSFEAGSIVGWVSGVAAILASARLVAWSVIYVRASQWFNKMTPWAVGLCRRTMYRISDNPDFLGVRDLKEPEQEELTR
jgi:hypothetical protein